MQLHTRHVPNISALENYDKGDVEKIVERSLARLGVTNFDLKRLREFVDAGFTPASVQLQYSVLDHRPEEEMAQYCKNQGIAMLAYRTVAGGFLSNKYLDKVKPLQDETRSSTKYSLIIEEFGGWDLFQELLQLLNEIARRQDTDISSVASAFILQRPGVVGVIVGARDLSHLKANQRIPNIQFSIEELGLLNKIFERRKGPHGAVYDLERYSMKHCSIMHTNNNLS